MENCINTEDFYGMVPGAIGVVRYLARTHNASQDAIDSLMNQMSSQRFSNYLSYGGGNMDPQTAFERFRREAREQAERQASGTSIMEMMVQIGQSESLDRIMKIEQSETFVQWEDENLIYCIKTTPIIDI